MSILIQTLIRMGSVCCIFLYAQTRPLDLLRVISASPVKGLTGASATVQCGLTRRQDEQAR